ncbi:MAG: zinc ABC transporter solute-binding protein [Leptolyngbyaceae cyanobacterium SM2_5_2]|nr:zinc ABC transporter solute-binding protein [Leptolyngbyaceae cyanobacterium SM2_5_2]
MFQYKLWQHPLKPVRYLGLAGGLILGFGLASCSERGTGAATPEPAAPSADAPLVVATTGVLCDLTQQIAESTVNLSCLMEPGQDPHTYQVTPSDRQAMEQAALILYDGFDTAPSITDMVESTNTDAPRVAVYQAAVPNPLMGRAHDHDHDHGHDHGAEAKAAHDHDHDHGAETKADDDHDHDHGAEAEAAHDHDYGGTATKAQEERAELVPDPHIWHNAANNGAIATVIADSLADINPDQAELYRQNAARLNEQFIQLDEWIAVQVDTIPANQRKLVTTHDSFRYFADAYGLEVAGALGGLSTDEKPTPSALTALVDQVKAAEVPAIFAETTTNPQLIETVAKDAGVAVAPQSLFVEGPGGPGSAAETTQAMLVVNTCTVVEALGGTCNQAEAPL